MKTKKRNIELAKEVCILMLIIFSIIHFLSEESLLLMGSKFEKLLHIHSEISVLKMQSFIEAIVTGILGSALVALVFYIQDYQSERERVLKKMMDFSDDYCNNYSKIPYCRYFEENEYSKLARKLYYEYYDNKQKKELKDIADGYLKTVPKAARRGLKIEVENNKELQECHDARSQIEEYLRTFVYKNIDEKKRGECIENEINTIIKEIDYKSELASDAYKQIMEIDLSKFSDLVESITTFKAYGYLKKGDLKKKLRDKEVFPQLYISICELMREQMRHIKLQHGIYGKRMAAYYVWSEYKCNTKNVSTRMLRIIQRTQKYIHVQFSIHNYDDMKKYNKKELLSLLMILQENIILKENHKIIPNSEPITFSYNKVVYGVNNLKMILLYDLTERYEYREKFAYAMKKDAYENNGHVWSNSFSGNDMRNDFFRI